MHSSDIQPGRYYSNGAYGRSWGVRMAVAITAGPDGEDVISFKGMAGTCRRKQGSCPLSDFSRWAKYEVQLNENSWQRVGYFEDEDEDEPEAASAGSD